MTRKRTPLNKQQQRRLAALFTSFLRGKKTLDKLIIFILSVAAILAVGARAHKDGRDDGNHDVFHGKVEQSYRCALKKIYDGDTVTARCNGQKGQQEIRIRLAGIDAPEMGQKPFGEESKRELGKRLGQNFDMHYLGPDYYQRSLGTLFVYGRNINLQMVEDGYAFAYDGKDTPPNYKEAEKNARAARRGFWRKNKNQQSIASKSLCNAKRQQPDNPKTWRRYCL